METIEKKLEDGCTHTKIDSGTHCDDCYKIFCDDCLNKTLEKITCNLCKMNESINTITENTNDVMNDICEIRNDLNVIEGNTTTYINGDGEEW